MSKYKPGDRVCVLSMGQDGIVRQVRCDSSGQPLIDLVLDQEDLWFIARECELSILSSQEGGGS